MQAAQAMQYSSNDLYPRPMSPYTHVFYDEPKSGSSTVYGSYGTPPVAPTYPMMISNAGAWIDERTFRVNSPSISTTMVGAQFMGAHGSTGITNQLATTSLSQPQIQASRIPEVAHQNSEVLHPGYRRIDKPARFFTLGRVFMMLWTEPAGRQPNSNPASERSRFSEVILGSHAYSEIRRFVVIKPGKGHCLCSPIHTYRGRGTLKEGVNPKEHAAIYLKSKGVELLPGEKLTIEPFPLILENEKNVQIDISSRINFGKIYTVEHNVRVLNVGRIDPTSVPRLGQLFSFNPITSADNVSEVRDSDKSGEK
ncbi:heterokaryon incompatibility protein [Rutstroemia sp. NJR-2017a BVV2]|nr:heterokaryon incompatibility protein [Rutstroemia sp. NJR-2017a BVV2]